MMQRVEVTLAEALQGERVRHARLLAYTRFYGLSAFALLFFVLGDVLQVREWHADWWLLLPYWAMSAVLWRAGIKAWQVRLSGVFIGAVDVPIVFFLQAVSLPTSASPGGVAGFTLGLFALLIMLASLSFRDSDIVVAVIIAGGCEITLQKWAGIGVGARVAASIVLVLVGVTGRYAGLRVRELAVRIYNDLLTSARLSQELSDAQSSFHALIEGMHDVVIAYRDAEIVYVNEALVRLCGYARADDLIGKPLTMLFNTEIPRQHVAFEIPLLRLNTDPAPLEATRLSLIFFGAPTHVLMGRDITDRKHALQQLSLTDRMVTMGMLAAGVAHEVNNPLASVRGNLELVKELTRAQRLRMDDMVAGDARQVVPRMQAHILGIAERHLDSPTRHDLANALTPLCMTFDLTMEYEIAFRQRFVAELEQLIDKASDGVAHVTDVAKNLKTLASPQDQKPVPIHLRPVLESTLAMSLHAVRGLQEITYDTPESYWVQGSASGLIQVLLNLVINASQAMDGCDVQKIHISAAAREDGFIVVSVRDTGNGIPLSTQKKLFTPFFTTKAVGVGTGMGLSLSKTIVEGMGGELSFESSVGLGTTFYVALRPAAPDIVDDHDVPTVRRPALDPAYERRGRVLVVDDNDMVADVVRRALCVENDVTVCNTGAEALERVRNGEEYDVVLCDIMMPGMTGVRLHGCVVEINASLADKMVFVSGSVYTDDVSQALARLPNPRLEKPFGLSDIREVVRRYVNPTT